jgi:phage/plasmid-associated DNA primase
MIVEKGILAIEKETAEQEKSRIKSNLIASRNAFLEKSLKEAMEYLIKGQDYPKKSQRERAEREIAQIESSTSIEFLNRFSSTFE